MNSTDYWTWVEASRSFDRADRKRAESTAGIYVELVDMLTENELAARSALQVITQGVEPTPRRVDHLIASVFDIFEDAYGMAALTSLCDTADGLLREALLAYQRST